MVVSRPGRLDSFAFQADDDMADAADAPAAATVPSFVLDDDSAGADF